MNLYNTVDLRPKIEKAIADEFAKASRQLDDIQAPEDLKTPLREMLESLNGRKK